MRGAAMLDSFRTRKFGLRLKISTASAVKSGAITISKNILVISSAVAASTVPFTATIPPKMDTGSHAYAVV